MSYSAGTSTRTIRRFARAQQRVLNGTHTARIAAEYPRGILQLVLALERAAQYAQHSLSRDVNPSQASTRSTEETDTNTVD